MLAILPFFSLLLLFFIFQHGHRDWRDSLLSAAIIWGVLLAISTEILSLFRLLTFAAVLVWWLIVNIVLVAIYYRLVQTGKRSLNFPSLPKPNPVSLVLLAGVACIVVIVGVIAVVSPPNNWDSMSYHMARVVHWIQNHSLAHYPTYYSAQLVHPPFAEITIVHLQILSGGDRWANLVQWSSMVGSIIGVSLIAKHLGANRRGQILAAVFCATLPMGILQASSTQNDYAVAFWLVCLAYYILLSWSDRKLPLYLVLSIGASLGLAICTKSSGYIYAFPFMVWWLISQWNHVGSHLWKPTLILGGLSFLLNVGHYTRNFNLYSNPLSVAEYAEHYRMEVYSFSAWISNIIRNISLHIDIVRHLNLQDFITPITGIGHKLIKIIHAYLLGIDANDPRTTFPPDSYQVPGLSFNENVAGNPLHFFIIILAIFLFLFHQEIRQNHRQLSSYLLAVIGGFLLLCWMLKIQPYHSRHHLSLFVLFSPFVGTVFIKSFNRHIVTMIAVLLLVTATPFVLKNQFRPIAAEQNIFNTSRNELYFTNRPHLIQPYFATAEFLAQKNCDRVGLSLGKEAIGSSMYWEYPFWVLLQQNRSQTIQFQHILHPENSSFPKSQKPPHNRFDPCAIIAVRRSKNASVETMLFQNEIYQKIWSTESNYITVLVNHSK